MPEFVVSFVVAVIVEAEDADAAVDTAGKIVDKMPAEEIKRDLVYSDAEEIFKG
jgi:hypothetical protein